MIFLRQSTASQSIMIGAFVDDTDFKTPETGLTIANTDIKLMKNGAASVNKNSGGGTHRINGLYSITLDATDSNTVGELMISVFVSGALVVWASVQVIEEAVYDLFYASGADGEVVLQGVTHTGAVIPTVTANTDMRGTDSAATATSLATVDGKIDDIQGATFATGTDSLEAIRNRGDAAWITGASGSGLTALGSGTTQGGTASTIQLASAETFATNELKGNVVKITSGTGAGQSRYVVSNIGATDTCTIAPDWITTPDATSVYEIVEGAASMQAILDDVVTETSAGFLSANFSVFYDNKNAVTTKILDDVGTAPPFPTSGWIWSTATTGVPIIGRLRGNNATIASITELSIHQESDDGKNTGLIISSLRDGDKIGVFFETNPDVFLIFDVTATPILTGSVYAVTGTVDSTSGSFANTKVSVSFDATAKIVDDVWDELKSAHTVPNSFGDFLDIEISSVNTNIDNLNNFDPATDVVLTSEILRTGTAQGAGTGSNQIQLDAGASSTDGLYDPSQVILTGGTGADQARNILQYDGTTKIATVDRNWKVIPDATTIFAIKGDAGREHVNEGLIQAGTSSTATLNTLASSDDDAYNGQILFIRSGTGDDQARLIIAYNGTTKIATIDRDWDTIPDTTSGYVMLATSLFSPSQLANTVWNEPLTGATHNTPNSSGKILRELKSAGIIAEGLCQATGQTVSNIRLASDEDATNDVFERNLIRIIAGTNIGFHAIISNYVGATKDCTITPSFPAACDNTSEYVIKDAMVHTETSTQGYVDGCVYFNSDTGTAGDEKDVNGTLTMPSNSFSDCLSLLSQLNINCIVVETGSTITLSAAFENKLMRGTKYTALLNGQLINNSTFEGASSISGIGNCATTPATFNFCGMGNLTLDPCNGFENGFFGTFTMRSEGVYVFGASAAFTAPGLGVTIDFGAGLNASQWSMQSWGGGSIEVQNMGAGTGSYSMESSGWGDFTINANCSATSSVDLHGNFVLTNNATGITVTQNANYELDTILSDSTAFQGADVAAILTDTGTTIPAQITALNNITAADVLAAGDIDGFSLEEAQKIELAALGGKLLGAATTTNTIRAADDSKDRITATVDADGNRTAVTLDGSG